MSSNSTSPPSVGFTFYNYDPSLAAAAIFAIIFGLSALVHIVHLCAARTWYFIPFAIGALFEAVGYIGRALSASEAPDFTKNPYIIQSILLLLGPALFAATIYMVLGRLIAMLGAEQYSLIRVRWLTKVFVLGDVLSFLAQSGGGGMLATSKSTSDVKRGESIILGGLGIQILFFALFILVTLVFHTRLRRTPTPASLSTATQPTWRSLLWALYASSAFILVRSVYRVAEYVQGRGGTIQASEWWLYVFDAALMALTTVVFHVWHPSRVIGRGGAGGREGDRLVGGYELGDVEGGRYPEGYKRASRGSRGSRGSRR